MSPEKTKSYLKLGIAVLILLFLILISSLIFPRLSNDSLINPGLLESFNLSTTFNFVFKSDKLSKIIQKNLEGKKGEYAIYIEDLSDGENYSLRGSDIFPAASLYKVYLIAAVLKEVEDGRLKVEDGITAKKEYLIEKFGGVDFGYEEAPEEIEYTVDEALTRVGRISDNFAAIMLADKIGWDKIQAMADSLNTQNTLIRSPISTSAADIGNFFKKLYLKQVVSESVSDKVIEFLELNQLNNRIPAGLPEEIRVIHKTGELSRIRHDAGIVWLDSTPGESKPTPGVSATQGVPLRAYVIVLMSKDLQYEDEGVETLANISKGVFEYFRDKHSGN